MPTSSFERAYNWPPSYGAYEDYQPYPSADPALLKVRDGANESNLIFATLVNKVQRYLRAIESQMQYTAESTTSPICQTKREIFYVSAPSRRPGLFITNARISIPFFFDTTEVEGSPLLLQSAYWGILATAVAYSETSAGRAYFPVSCGVNTPTSFTANVSVIKTRGLNVAANRFNAGDVIEVTCMLINPYGGF
jgi:hypothetical protein